MKEYGIAASRATARFGKPLDPCQQFWKRVVNSGRDDMLLNQFAEYALRASVYLATLEHGDYAAASDIAEHTNVPIHYLQKVLRQLTKRGILNARRGMGGGFCLSRETDRITIYEVLRACDSEPKRIKECPLGIGAHLKLCPLHHLIDQQIAINEAAFKAKTLRDIMESQHEVKALCRSKRVVPLGIDRSND